MLTFSSVPQRILAARLCPNPGGVRDLFFVDGDRNDARRKSYFGRTFAAETNVQHRALDALSLTRRFAQHERVTVLHAHVVVDDTLDERNRVARSRAIECVGTRGFA